MATQQVTLAKLQSPWRIGIDVGGTFTDLMLADSAGATHVAKVPSVPSDPSRGVLAALELSVAVSCDLVDDREDVAVALAKVLRVVKQFDELPVLAFAQAALMCTMSIST